MSADFWASYLSGALGIAIGNRLDIWKTELQAGNRYFLYSNHSSNASILQRVGGAFRGAAAPIIGYGALNSIIFMTYNRTLLYLEPSIFDVTKLAGVSLGTIWLAGAAGGLAGWVFSTPSELIKCRTQLSVDGRGSSFATFVDVWKTSGLRGLYLGGTITSLRDSIGFGWYFWSYELSKRLLLSRQADPFAEPRASELLIAGGIAGVITWASIFPLDVIKTRLQTQSSSNPETGGLLAGPVTTPKRELTSWRIATDIIRTEGIVGFFRGIGVCSLRAFIVNAVQWYIYERCMVLMRKD